MYVFYSKEIKEKIFWKFKNKIVLFVNTTFKSVLPGLPFIYSLSKISLLFFKIFPIKIYISLQAFEPILEALLPLWLRYFQNMHFKHQILQVSKNVDLSFYFLHTGIKGTIWRVTHQCFECSKMLLFEPMCESSHCRGEEWSVFGGWFSWFLGRQLEKKWLCTTQNWLLCVVLVERLRHVQFFQKKRRSFVWKCFVRE